MRFSPPHRASSQATPLHTTHRSKPRPAQAGFGAAVQAARRARVASIRALGQVLNLTQLHFTIRAVGQVPADHTHPGRDDPDQTAHHARYAHTRTPLAPLAAQPLRPALPATALPATALLITQPYQLQPYHLPIARTTAKDASNIEPNYPDGLLPNAASVCFA